MELPGPCSDMDHGGLVVSYGALPRALKGHTHPAVVLSLTIMHFDVLRQPESFHNMMHCRC